MEASLRHRYPGLVWSNPSAPQEVYIRQALLNPRFSVLLKMAGDFGLKDLKREWKILVEYGGQEILRVASEVERIFLNLEAGYLQSKNSR